MALSIALSIAVAPRVASSQDAASVELARSLFNAGAQAYSVGKYAAAIKAFEQAYRLAPRPTIAFSMAQAHRRQYVLTKQPENLRGAVKYYREYTSKVEQGGRVDDAASALAELEPLVAKLDAASPTGPAPESQPAPPSKSLAAQLMVSPAVTEAMVSLDGAPPSPVPFIKDVDPGKHKLKVTADGYFDYERELDVKPGAVVPVLDVPLREKPARLTIQCQPGADVSIDGRLVTTTPLLSPLDLPGGRHFIAVTKGGHKPFSQDIDVKRGEAKTLTFKLETTAQRIISYTSLIGGGVSAGLGVVISLLALGEQAKAEQILAAKSRHNITTEDVDAYNNARTQRDELRQGASALLGTGVALMGGGLLLYVFDSTPAVAPPARSDDGSKKPGAPAPSQPTMEIGAAPLVTPGFVGGSIVGRF